MTLFSDPTTHAVGLDLSDHVLRLIEIRRGPFYRPTLQLHRYAEERLPDGLVQRGEFKDTDLIIQHLKSLLKKAYGRHASRGAVVSLPETRTFIKVISVKMPDRVEDLDKAVLTEAERHIPTALSDLYIDWQPSEDVSLIPAGHSVTVTIGAAPKIIVDGYTRVLEAAGIIPVAFEIEAEAIVRSIIKANDPAAADRAIGIIDFGATRSSFIVFDRGTIQFTVSIPLSGDEVTRRISETLGVSLEEAERAKRQCGVDAHKCGTALWDIAHPFLQEMTDRILDAVNFYRDHFAGGRPLGQIIISGGGANMARIDELLSDLTKTEVVKADPWINVDPDRCPLPREIILSSTTAVGLALRPVVENAARKAQKAKKAPKSQSETKP
jgi:type IV pilus assembly protein PilM